jgi:hypothetical protein
MQVYASVTEGETATEVNPPTGTVNEVVNEVSEGKTDYD